MSISVALTKGRLEKATVKLLEERGYGIECLKDKGRALVFQDTKKDIRYFLVKSNDCITYVQHGVADIGVVGKDTLLEGGKDYYEMLDLGIGKCKFIVAGLPEHNLFDKVELFTFDTSSTFAFDTSFLPTDASGLLYIICFKRIKHHIKLPPCNMVCKIIDFFSRDIDCMKKC